MTVAADNQSEFDQWLQQETSSFQEYKDKRDKEFTQFLKTQWREMQTFQGLVRDKTPKPVIIPVARPEPAKKPIKIKPEKPVKKTPVIKPPPVKPVIKPEKKIKHVPTVRLPKGESIQVHFYGHDLNLAYDPQLKISLPGRINETAMSQHWSSLSRANYESLIKQLDGLRASLQLNDWAYVLLVNTVARKIYPRQANEQVLLIWFILVKESYRARIAYDARQVYLLMPTRQPLYAAPYFTFNHVRYYALSFDGKKQRLGRVFTYDGQYPGANKSLDMSLDRAIKTVAKQNNKKLKFKFQGQVYLIDVAYDQNTVGFFRTYPQMDIAMYYKADVEQDTAQQLLQQLRPLVAERSEQEAVNLLLRFVQTAFAYKTDEQQFGVENYLFFEETLHYPYSDCEDRSVFFAWLVRNLLGLDVVGLDYPGHIAAAVHFNHAIEGDALIFKGRQYVVTDPTYINASVGMTMPAFRNKRPRVIAIAH